MVGVEIDMVVTDSIKALALYESIFDVVPVEVTNYAQGMNEAVFTMYGTRFHLLDENPEYQLTAPKEGDAKPMWVNVLVADIKDTFGRAIDAGCSEVQPVTELADFGVSNAIFSDPFGYVWLLHQIHREVSFEERSRIFEEQMKAGKE
ncbi:VOC family protein [Dehalobacterium formicoaceticum]|uniref:VOC family protein n=1 Tax=Dehalobacterium formicoaceticum TaxID=51515 RepID=A0ABT1Y7Z5_9FIRM|nr:VOC family protein [Dehalobacterium formicoaceticum]MCR6546009.1 VOC family protein [Dehalobacterium formicoaceticum]